MHKKISYTFSLNKQTINLWPSFMVNASSRRSDAKKKKNKKNKKKKKNAAIKNILLQTNESPAKRLFTVCYAIAVAVSLCFTIWMLKFLNRNLPSFLFNRWQIFVQKKNVQCIRSTLTYLHKHLMSDASFFFVCVRALPFWFVCKVNVRTW